MSKLNSPVALIIMDGWGIGSDNDANNAVVNAKTPVIDRLLKDYPHTQLACSGSAVGLPDGQMGNSEVGHMNMGAGRIVYQELTRITKAIEDKTFFDNPVFLDVIGQVKKSGGALHLMGLLSDGGVHSHQKHLYALLELAKKSGLTKVYIHAFMDGRDVPPTSGAGYLKQLEDEIKKIGIGTVATISGRYYAMDRDKRWNRVEKAYRAIAEAKGEQATASSEAIKASYSSDKTDEFVVPTVVGSYKGMKDGDGVIFFNFRPDRARELTHAFTDQPFDGFVRGAGKKLAFAMMTQYEKGINAQIAYAPQKLTNTLGEVICQNGCKQLRIAETEKYAHVTFFFNGGVEQPLPGEDRILVPSPKVATYDLQPEMSAVEVTDKVVAAIKSRKYDFIILNYANGDMVGHTGVLPAAIKAVETVDTCVGRFVDAIKSVGGTVCITADHGNAEKMFDETTNGPFTAHTTNPVPFIAVSDKIKAIHTGALCDIAPTLLQIAGLSIPSEMTGESLVD